jgi:hypothetical protein
MDFDQQKKILKRYRKELLDSNNQLHVEFAGELVNQINTLIGRINCYITDDDKKLKRLADRDKI